MSRLIPPPPPTTPIGVLGPNGRVTINHEWAYYLTVGIFQRLGGFDAPSLDELARRTAVVNMSDDTVIEELFFIPPPPQSEPPQQVVLMLQDETYVEETYILRP